MNETPRTEEMTERVGAVLRTKKRLVQVAGAVAVAGLVAAIGFGKVDIGLGLGCGSAKVAGKTICPYIDQLGENEDSEELVTTLGKVAKFGAKGAKAIDAVRTVFRDHDEDDVRAAAFAALKAIGKGQANDTFMPLLIDEELEMSSALRVDMMKEVLPQAKPEEYVPLLTAVVHDDVERFAPASKALNEFVATKASEMKSKKGAARLNAWIDAQLWQAEFEPKDGELSLPDEMLKFRGEAFLGLAVLVMPEFSQMGDGDAPKNSIVGLKLKVDQDKINQLRPRLEAIVEKSFENMPDKMTAIDLFPRAIGLALLMAKNPEHALERYEELYEASKAIKDMPDNARMGIFSFPLFPLVPPGCMGLGADMKPLAEKEWQSAISKEKGKAKWNADIAEKMLAFSKGLDKDPLGILIDGVGTSAALCKLSGSEEFVERMMERALEQGRLPKGRELIVNLMYKTIRDKKVSEDLGKRFKEKFGEKPQAAPLGLSDGYIP